MKVLIIEDENVAVQRLTDMLRNLDRDIEVLKVLDSVEASVTYLQTSPVIDLIFMDIELGDGQSFNIFDQVRVDMPVIFITAYQEHALKAFKQNSIDYLLKPLNKEELALAITKYKRLHDQSGHRLQQNVLEFLKSVKTADFGTAKDRFLAKSGTRLISVPVENIAYFYTKERLQYLKTHANDDFIMDKPLDDIEAELDPKAFFRANRQFVVGYGSIEKVHSWFSGKLKVQVKPASYEDVIVSRLKAADFKKWLGE